jgi:hypothetical protein
MIALVAVACVAGGLLGLLGLRVFMGYGVTFHSKFTKIRPGMSEAQVVAALGVADERAAQFRLGQYGGFEKEYARAAASGSTYYLLWNKGIDVVYAVGFDKDGRVTMKAVGRT